MSHFLSKEVKSLKDLALTTPPPSGLAFSMWGNEMIGLANLPYGAIKTVVRHTTKLEADFVLIDLGS